MSLWLERSQDDLIEGLEQRFEAVFRSRIIAGFGAVGRHGVETTLDRGDHAAGVGGELRPAGFDDPGVAHPVGDLLDRAGSGDPELAAHLAALQQLCQPRSPRAARDAGSPG